MRTHILVAALLLSGTAANATGLTRSLSASPPSQAIETQQPYRQAEATLVQAPEQVQPVKAEQPKAIVSKADPKVDAPKAEAPKSQSEVAPESKATKKADRPQRKRISTETRVINALHRHGIYW